MKRNVKEESTKKLSILGLALLSALTWAEAAYAQISCGPIDRNTRIWQTQVSPGPKVRAMTTTSREVSLCGMLQVRAEGWIGGYGGAMGNIG